MDCREFLERLDALVDCEVDAADRQKMLEHAKQCASCSRELRMAQAIRETMLEMDQGIVPPLTAQAAWRKAVKAEAGKRSRRGMYRALCGLAAAFVVLVGTTAVFRQTGVLDFETETGAGPMRTSGTVSQIEYYGRRPSYDQEVAVGRAAVVESDGEETTVQPIVGDGARSVPQTTGAEPETTGMASSPEGADALEAGDTQAADRERLMVRSATREMYSEDFDSARSAIEDLVEEYDASFVSNALDTQGGVRKAVMAIDVPMEDLENFLQAVDYVGQVTYSEVRSEDISDNYYDAQGRLETLSAEKERLTELIAAADSSEEMETLKAQLEDVYQQMDVLEGKIRGFDAQMRYARVDVTLIEGTPEAVPVGTTGGEIQQGFSRSMQSLGDFFGDMAVSLAVIAPYAGLALALAVCIGIVVVLVKRRKHG